MRIAGGSVQMTGVQLRRQSRVPTMPIVHSCPACESRLKVPSRMAGTWIKCPKCAVELKIPGSPVPQEPASPSPFVFQSEEPAPSLPIIEPFNMASPDYPIPNSYQRDPQRDYQLRDLAPYLFSGLAICLLIIFVTQSPAIRDHLRDSAERRKQGQDEIDR